MSDRPPGVCGADWCFASYIVATFHDDRCVEVGGGRYTYGEYWITTWVTKGFGSWEEGVMRDIRKSVLDAHQTPPNRGRQA